jgi:hypothetical protein
MEVKGIPWIGVETDRLSDMRSFAIEVLGLRLVGEDTAEFVELGMADGAKLERFGSAAVADGPWLFPSNPVVAGFLVYDIKAAREELMRTPGVELLGDLRILPDGTPGSTSARRTGMATSSPLSRPRRADRSRAIIDGRPALPALPTFAAASAWRGLHRLLVVRSGSEFGPKRTARSRPNRQSTVGRGPAAGEDERAPCTASTNLQPARTGGDDRRHRRDAVQKLDTRRIGNRSAARGQNGWPTLSGSGRLAKITRETNGKETA